MQSLAELMSTEQCDIPPLDEGVTYTQVSAGSQYHTVLLRSDGCAVACGKNLFKECDIPSLDEGVPQVIGIRCFSEVMALQLLADAMITENVEFHLFKSWSEWFRGQSPSLCYIVTFLI